MDAQNDIAVATAILAGIKELIELYEAHSSGKVSAADALQAAQLFTDRIAANRAAAMKALDEKFSKGTP